MLLLHGVRDSDFFTIRHRPGEKWRVAIYVHMGYEASGCCGPSARRFYEDMSSPTLSTGSLRWT